MAKELISLGIKALLNFCYVDLDVPEDVIVENVHLRDNLMVLAYKYDNLIKKKEINKQKTLKEISVFLFLGCFIVLSVLYQNH